MCKENRHKRDNKRMKNSRKRDNKCKDNCHN